MKKNILGLAAAVLLSGVLSPVANATLLEPTPYLSVADSPFSGIDSYYFYNEDFEDGALNTPGVVASSGRVLQPGMYTDSVDGDDGLIDGLGTAGHSWYVQSPTLTFTFDAEALQGLPTHVGIVWTDVGFAPVLGFGSVTFEAFDAANNSMGVLVSSLGDGSFFGETAEDRFFGGVNKAGGISRFTIATASSFDWEVDHLQYGRAVPVPTTLALFGLGLVLVAGITRRRAASR